MPELAPEVLIPLVLASYSTIFFCFAFVAFFGFYAGEFIAELFKSFLKWRERRKEKK